MIESLFRTAVPIVLGKLYQVPAIDKLEYAALLEDLACAYREDRQSDFAALLAKMSFPPDMQSQIVSALWADE